MARTPFATRTYDTPQKGLRVPAGAVGFVVVHHTGGSGFEATIQMELGTRQVSSTVIIQDDQIASMFDEAYRAWSLSSQYWDSVSLSSETCNSGGAAEGWPISEASYASLARVIADWCRRYNIPANRERILGHREVYTRYGASYATACPGGIDLDRVVRDVAAILAGGSGSTQGDTMTAVLDLKVAPETAVRSFIFDVGVIRRTDAGEIALLQSVEPSVTHKQALASPGGAINTTTDDATFQKIMNVFHLSEFTIAQVKALAVGQSLVSARLHGSGGSASALDLSGLEALIKSLPAALDAQLDDEQTQLVTLLNGLPAAVRAKIVAPL